MEVAEYDTISPILILKIHRISTNKFIIVAIAVYWSFSVHCKNRHSIDCKIFSPICQFWNWLKVKDTHWLFGGKGGVWGKEKCEYLNNSQFIKSIYFPPISITSAIAKERTGAYALDSVGVKLSYSLSLAYGIGIQIFKNYGPLASEQMAA